MILWKVIFFVCRIFIDSLGGVVDDRIRQEVPVAVSNIELPTPSTPPTSHLVATALPIQPSQESPAIIVDDLDGEKLPPRKTVEDEILSTFMNAVNGILQTIYVLNF